MVTKCILHRVDGFYNVLSYESFCRHDCFSVYYSSNVKYHPHGDVWLALRYNNLQDVEREKIPGTLSSLIIPENAGKLVAMHYIIWRSCGLAPVILNFGARWRGVYSLSPRPLYSKRKLHLYRLDRRLDEHLNLNRRFGGDKTIMLLEGIKPRISQPVGRSLYRHKGPFFLTQIALLISSLYLQNTN